MAQHERYADGALWAAFKRIRNRLRKLDPMMLTFLCSRRLHELRTLEGPQTSELPWNLLLLIKWAHLYGAPHQGEVVDYATYRRLVNETHDLPSHLVNRRVGFFLKNMANQQFWLQRSWDVRHLLRTQQIFLDSDSSGDLDRWFRELNGLTIGDWLELAVALYSLVGKKEPLLSVDSFGALITRHRLEKIARFLDGLALSARELPAFFNRSGQRTLAGEIFEQTPLRRKPLLRLEPRVYHVYSPTLVFRSLEYGVFDVLREADSERLGQLLGRPFERYVESLLQPLGRTSAESAVRRRIGPTRKNVDFLVESPRLRLLVECKAVGLTDRAQVARDPVVLRRALKNSVEKAIVQALATISALPDEGLDHYLFVVTYKDLQLGPIREILVDEGRDEFVRHCRDQNLDPNRLPLERVFLVPVDSLEDLAVLALEERLQLADLLQTASRDAAAFESMRFDLGLYLAEHKAGAHPLIHSAKDRLFSPLLEALGARVSAPGQSG